MQLTLKLNWLNLSIGVNPALSQSHVRSHDLTSAVRGRMRNVSSGSGESVSERERHLPIREIPIFSPLRSASVWYLDSLPTLTAQLRGLRESRLDQLPR